MIPKTLPNLFSCACHIAFICPVPSNRLLKSVYSQLKRFLYPDFTLKVLSKIKLTFWVFFKWPLTYPSSGIRAVLVSHVGHYQRNFGNIGLQLKIFFGDHTNPTFELQASFRCGELPPGIVAQQTLPFWPLCQETSTGYLRIYVGLCV